MAIEEELWNSLDAEFHKLMDAHPDNMEMRLRIFRIYVMAYLALYDIPSNEDWAEHDEFGPQAQCTNTKLEDEDKWES
jgi:hypothetical protein